MAPPFGNKNAYKGSNVHRHTGHKRAQRLVKLKPCYYCNQPGVERHHKDENTLNNNLDNIVIVCRRCHMLYDGRLEKLKNQASKAGKARAKQFSQIKTITSVIRQCIINNYDNFQIWRTLQNEFTLIKPYDSYADMISYHRRCLGQPVYRKKNV